MGTNTENITWKMHYNHKKHRKSSVKTLAKREKQKQV